MSTELIHIGFGNYISANHLIGVASPASAPIKRLIHEGRTKGITLDMTSGRRTKAVIFMQGGSVVLAAITPETVEGRVRSHVHGAEELE
ncbi:MAG: DUF370 domain-containing protein [Chloroflexi bacterium]|nr:DUF370 domain-containing protein [Chloroflexota bacterium]